MPVNKQTKRRALWQVAAAFPLAACLATLPVAAGAATFSMQAGYGRDNGHGVEKYEVFGRWDDIAQWQFSNRFSLAVDGEVNIANWRALSRDPSSQLMEFGRSSG